VAGSREGTYSISGMSKEMYAVSSSLGVYGTVGAYKDSKWKVQGKLSIRVELRFA